MTMYMNTVNISITNEFVERVYTTKQVEEANTSEMLNGIDTSHCSFLNSNALSVPLTVI
jgi:hypothetical protein